MKVHIERFHFIGFCPETQKLEFLTKLHYSRWEIPKMVLGGVPIQAIHPLPTPGRVQGALILLRRTMFQNKVNQVIIQVK